MSGTARRRIAEGVLIGLTVVSLAALFGWWVLFISPALASYAIWRGEP
jgi:hypothetical protein